MILLVGSGGFIGSAARFLIARYIELKYMSSFPFGTLTVNAGGCLLIGLLYGLSVKNAVSPETRLFLAAGFCGGFTTFSTFSYEFLMLMQDQQAYYGLLYTAGSLVVGFFATWLGMNLTKLI